MKSFYTLLTTLSLAFVQVQAQTYDVTAFGAKGDGKTKDTSAVQAAIDAAHAAGGGVVSLGPGTYLCGTIYLKSNVVFEIGPGATVKGSTEAADYCAANAYMQNGASKRESENHSGGHLFVALEQHDVTVRGPGVIDGNGLHFATYDDGRERFHQRNYDWRPGQMMHFVECTNVRIENVSLVNAPYWNCFVHGCEHVFVQGVRVETPRAPHVLNGDGFTIDACRFVTIMNCQIIGYDDGLTIRCGTRKLKNKKRECAFVTVANCTLSSRMNAIRVGVGNGLIHDVTFSNIAIHDTRTAINFCSSWGAYGTPIRNVRFSNFTVDALDFLRMHQNGALTSIEDVHFADISGFTRKRSCIWGRMQMPFRRITLRNVRLNQGLEAIHTEDLQLIDCGLEQIELTPAEIELRDQWMREGKDPLC